MSAHDGSRPTDPAADGGAAADDELWRSLEPPPFVCERRNPGDVMVALDWYDGAAWLGYSKGYLLAGQHIHDTAARLMHEREALVFPMVFLLRHAIELKLKQTIINAVRTIRAREPVDDAFARRFFKDRHYLPKLTATLVETLRRVWPAEHDPLLERLRDQILLWDAADPASTAFRYPDDRDGGPIVELDGRVLNLTVVAEMAREVYFSLEAIDAALQTERDEWSEAMALEYERNEYYAELERERLAYLEADERRFDVERWRDDDGR